MVLHRTAKSSIFSENTYDLGISILKLFTSSFNKIYAMIGLKLFLITQIDIMSSE